MPSVPKKVYERLVTSIKQFQPILVSAKSRDVNETDTVTIIKDMLGDVFEYDKYSEVTSIQVIFIGQAYLHLFLVQIITLSLGLLGLVTGVLTLYGGRIL